MIHDGCCISACICMTAHQMDVPYCRMAHAQLWSRGGVHNRATPNAKPSFRSGLTSSRTVSQSQCLQSVPHIAAAFDRSLAELFTSAQNTHTCFCLPQKPCNEVLPSKGGAPRRGQASRRRRAAGYRLQNRPGQALAGPGAAAVVGRSMPLLLLVRPGNPGHIIAEFILTFAENRILTGLPQYN